MKTPKSCSAFFYEYPNEWIFVVGGETAPNNQTKECERFNVFKKRWETLPDLPEVRCNPGLTVYNQSLYAFGGFCGGVAPYYVAQSSIFVLDLNSLNLGWTTVCLNKPMTPIATPSIIPEPENSRILIIGGWTGNV